jgi:RimJ/RimL family protein N-acetyltransferase
MHRSIDDTKAFLEFSDLEWERWPAGPFLIFSLADGELLGSTGLGFDLPHRASTGYVLAKDSWGQGIATEAVQAICKTASDLAVKRLFAHCHPDHRASRRVLEKAGFELEGTLRRYSEFPNLEPGVARDVVCYSCIPDD